MREFFVLNVVLIFLFSCGNRVDKHTEAFDLVKKERMMSGDTGFVSKETILRAMKTEPPQDDKISDEWTNFKIETENKISSNEIKIKKIKFLSYTNSSLYQKLTRLEGNNRDLKERLKKYENEVNLKWKTFKISMTDTVNEIDINIDNINSSQLK
jgi:hypothetical protein